MAGLSNFISNQATQQTTMPSWYDQAQQNVVNMATTGAQNVPTLGQTVAGGAIQQLQGPQNPFTQAQSTLNQIATGAANPWIVSDTGQVTPNVATPLGGLFQAQNQALQQLMPQYTAPVEAGAIGSGQFGSLRGKTAVDKAMADAQSKLFADQMQAALQAQGIGAQAATGLGNVGAQGVTSMTNLGQAQQADPMLAASALGKILGGMQVGTTQKNLTQLSPLNQIGSIASALGGSVAGTDALLKQLFPAKGTPGQPGYQAAQGIGSFLQKVLGGGGSGYEGSGLGSGFAPGTYNLADGGKIVIGQDGSKIIQNADGTVNVFDKYNDPLGGSANAGDVGPGGVTYQDLFNTESGYQTYTPEQLNEYQNYYNTPSDVFGGYNTGEDWDMG